MAFAKFIRAFVIILLALGPCAAVSQDDPGAPQLIDVPATSPNGIAYDEARDLLLVSDTGGRRIVLSTAADFSTGSSSWTDFGFVADASNASALLAPQGISVDDQGNVFVADSGRGRIFAFRRDTSTGDYVLDTSFVSGNPETVDGVRITRPRDVHVASDGRIYAVDSGNSRILVADDIDDTSWSVWGENPEWGHIYGIETESGFSMLLASPEQHGVRAISGPAVDGSLIGRYGEDQRGLRYPRGARRLSSGDILVVDTFNHRLNILGPVGQPRFTLGNAALFHTPTAAAVDDEGRIFVVDAGYDRVVAWTGESAAFDMYIRDHAFDDGAEPSGDPGVFALSSPDIVVRHDPIANFSTMAPASFGSIPFEQPRHDRNNYVYAKVWNTGPLPSTPSQVRFFWGDPSSPLSFPADWQTDGFFHSWSSEMSNQPANWMSLPSIAPMGVALVGPIVFRPSDPDALPAADAKMELFARIVSADDPSMGANDLDGVRLSNNVARRGLLVKKWPFPTGPQDTLVVLADFPAMPGPVDQVTVEQRIAEVSDWVEEISYGTAQLHPVFRGPISLDHDRLHYETGSNTLLVDMTLELVGKLLADDPTSLDGADPEETEDDIDRLVVVLDDSSFTGNYATTGSFPFLIDGEIRRFSVSIQGPGNTTDQYAYGLSHQFGLLDLLEHPDADFARPYADGWDTLAFPINGVHPLVWNKMHAEWPNTADVGVHWVRRPNSIVNGVNIPLTYQSAASETNTAAIAFGLTKGLTSFESEDHKIWVEARSNVLGDEDTDVPMSGVIVYDANDLIRQGLGPVIVRDFVPGTGDDLTDAAIPVGESMAVPGTGITIDVGPEIVDPPGVIVTYEYDPPITDYDVGMAQGNPSWMSPAIWIDNQSDGYDEEEGRDPTPSEAPAIEGEENRVYVRVENHGPADAHDVEVAVFFSSPYHTVDGEGAFDYFTSVIIPFIPAGETITTFVTWEPPAGEGPHHCARVVLRRLLNDTNSGNNTAQRNLRVEESTTSSPYTAVTSQYTAANDGVANKLVYFTAEGIPDEWDWSFDSAKALIAPGDIHEGSFSIKPHDDAPVCTTQRMQIEGWRKSGNTLVRLGGMNVNVDLRRTQDLRTNVSLGNCPERRVENERFGLDWDPHGYSQSDLKHGIFPPWIKDPKQCRVVQTSGCTDPAQANQTITIRYTDETGTPVYREVQTDENGCYEDFFVTASGGNWEVEATYSGTICAGMGVSVDTVEIDLPIDADRDDDGIKDEEEQQGDVDGDGIPNHLDPDSDGDGTSDGLDHDPFGPPPSDDGLDLDTKRPRWIFEPNLGQSRSGTHIARGPAASLVADANLLFLRVPLKSDRDGKLRADAAAIALKHIESLGIAFQPDSVNVATPVPLFVLARKHHYIKSQPLLSRSDVPTYRALRWQELWKGVDWTVGDAANSAGLGLSFALRPGSHSGRIRMNVVGIDDLKIAPDNSLEVITDAGVLRLSPPRAVLTLDGISKPIKAVFEIDGHSFGIKTEKVDDKGALSISTDLDAGFIPGPTINGIAAKATDLVGGDHNWVSDVDADQSGLSLVAGSTGDFDTAMAIGPNKFGLDGYLVRADKDLRVQSVTFIGGGASDALTGVFADRLGRISFVGYTGSDRLPVVGAWQGARSGGLDGLVGEFLPDGRSIRMASYFGGKEDDALLSIDPGAESGLAVGGWSRSEGMRLRSAPRPHSGQKDGIVAFFKSLAKPPAFWAFIGGSADDFVTTVRAGTEGLYVGGSTQSEDFPGKTGSHGQLRGSSDGFLAKFKGRSPDLEWAHLVGGKGRDIVTGIDTDRGVVGASGTSTRLKVLEPFPGNVEASGKITGVAFAFTHDGDPKWRTALSGHKYTESLDIIALRKEFIAVGAAGSSPENYSGASWSISNDGKPADPRLHGVGESYAAVVGTTKSLTVAGQRRASAHGHTGVLRRISVSGRASLARRPSVSFERKVEVLRDLSKPVVIDLVRGSGGLRNAAQIKIVFEMISRDGDALVVKEMGHRTVHFEAGSQRAKVKFAVPRQVNMRRVGGTADVEFIARVVSSELGSAEGGAQTRIRLKTN